MPDALFVFAHQDDEIAAAARITLLLRAGWTITCAYLTNGETERASSAVRDEESRKVLARLGVTRAHFIGSEERIPDGRLIDHLDRALALLDGRIEHAGEVYCLSYEGGHQDHDASHLVAVAFAARRNVSCYEMPLYHGYRLPGPVFRTLAPLRNGGEWTPRAVPLRERLRIASLCRFYVSQRRTWIGLLPGAIFRRKEWIRRADVERLRAKPHDGKLFYERRFGVTWEEFEARARPFVAAIRTAPLPPPA